MRKIISTTFLTLLITALPIFAEAQIKSTPENNYIEVNANAFIEVAPDEFYLQITIDESLTGNKSSLEKKERELFTALKGLGIDLEKDMQIQDVTSSLKNYIFKQAKILNTKSYTLKVRTPEQIMGVFNAAEKIKISQVTITKTGVSNPDKIKEEVLAKAALKAKSNATVLAETLGSKLGKPIFIQNYDNMFNPFRSLTKSTLSIRGIATEAAGDEALPELEFEKIRFEQQVLVRFAIE